MFLNSRLALLTIGVFGLPDSNGSQQPQSDLATTVEIMQDAIKQTLPYVRSDRVTIDEPQTRARAIAVSSAFGFADLPVSGRLIRSLPPEVSDSVARCDQPPKRREEFCAALSTRSVMSIQGAQRQSETRVLVRVRVTQWAPDARYPAPWFVSELSYVRTSVERWTFRRVERMYAG